MRVDRVKYTSVCQTKWPTTKQSKRRAESGEEVLALLAGQNLNHREQTNAQKRRQGRLQLLLGKATLLLPKNCADFFVFASGRRLLANDCWRVLVRASFCEVGLETLKSMAAKNSSTKKTAVGATADSSGVRLRSGSVSSATKLNKRTLRVPQKGFMKRLASTAVDTSKVRRKSKRKSERQNNNT